MQRQSSVAMSRATDAVALEYALDAREVDCCHDSGSDQPVQL